MATTSLLISPLPTYEKIGSRNVGKQTLTLGGDTGSRFHQKSKAFCDMHLVAFSSLSAFQRYYRGADRPFLEIITIFGPMCPTLPPYLDVNVAKNMGAVMF